MHGQGPPSIRELDGAVACAWTYSEWTVRGARPNPSPPPAGVRGRRAVPTPRTEPLTRAPSSRHGPRQNQRRVLRVHPTAGKAQSARAILRHGSPSMAMDSHFVPVLFLPEPRCWSPSRHTCSASSKDSRSVLVYYARVTGHWLLQLMVLDLSSVG
jgi:hypothetical protein